VDETLHYFLRQAAPRELGAAEVTAFLNHLALQRHVAASTQNQALAVQSLFFLDVLGG